MCLIVTVLTPWDEPAMNYILIHFNEIKNWGCVMHEDTADNKSFTKYELLI